MTRGQEPGGRPVEDRLRQALDARAAGITVRELRPAQPPEPGVRRLSWAWPRGFTLPLAGLAAAAATVVGYAVLAPDAPVRPGPVPAPPAAPPTPTPTGPSPGPVPAGPSPSVSPSRLSPSAVPTHSYSPTVSPSRAPEAGTGTPRPSSSASAPSSPSPTPTPTRGSPSASSRPPTTSPGPR
ncbi:hypothetical protein OG730_03395 [Streptomyces sp. NBC_01298]|uniref:hypothetical protein n=1 Tax=Streptomyces sp. NBC_01298 TaxID=2903817 RepID=UPI002E161762|nr:hypothetical protein OG730_03395 [Streptomyces sp. NBC_01298]